MAKQVVNWMSTDGQMFPTEAEADHQDRINEIAEILAVGGGHVEDFDVDGAANYLLGLYLVVRREDAI